VLSVSFIKVFSPINVTSFLRKHLTQAFSYITFALSQLLIKYLSSTSNFRINLHDATTTTLTPKNIYLPVQYYLQK